MAFLKVLKGPNAGTVYELTANESVLGRYPFCDVVLPSHTISRQHARVVKVEEKFYVEDLNSLNGTFLNGERVRRRTLLKEQDRIRLYEILLIFHERHGVKDDVDVEEPQPGPQRYAATEPFVPPLVGEVDESIELDEPQAELEVANAGSDSVSVVSALELRSGACGGGPGQELLRTVLATMREVSGSGDVNAILPKALEAALTIFPQADRGHILLVEQPGGRLEVKASKHRHEDTITSMTIGPISQAVAKRVIARGEAVLSGGEVGEEGDSVLDDSGRSMMCAPLLGPSRTPLGIIHLDSGSQEQAFAEADLHVLISVGLIAGQALEFALLLGEK